MGPINATKSALGKYITFKGRASRSEYWWFGLVQIFVILGVAAFEARPFLTEFAPIIDRATDLGISREQRALLILQTFFSFFKISLGLFLFLILPNISVTVRRLHDSNLKGWWYFVSLIPYIGGFIFLYLMMRKSHDAGNRFGPSPFDPSATPPASPAPHTQNKKPKVVKVPKIGPRFARKSKPKAGKTKYADLVRPRAPLHTGPMHHSAQ